MNRKYHPWWLWECHKAGFFETVPPAGMEKEDAINAYRDFLRDSERFKVAMDRVIREWPHSCEQFLTNTSMNRVAWMGQASMCISTGVPSCFRAGFKLLTQEEQGIANRLAEASIVEWEKKCKQLVVSLSTLKTGEVRAIQTISLKKSHQL